MSSETKWCRVCEKPASLRCGACQTVWYCTKECQRQDWPRHKTRCNKDVCAQCKARGTEFKQCSHCGMVKYCSPSCQKTHWSSHKSECKTCDRVEYAQWKKRWKPAGKKGVKLVQRLGKAYLATRRPSLGTVAIFGKLRGACGAQVRLDREEKVASLMMLHKDAVLALFAHCPQQAKDQLELIERNSSRFGIWVDFPSEIVGADAATTFFTLMELKNDDAEAQVRKLIQDGHITLDILVELLNTKL